MMHGPCELFMKDGRCRDTYANNERILCPYRRAPDLQYNCYNYFEKTKADKMKGEQNMKNEKVNEDKIMTEEEIEALERFTEEQTEEGGKMMSFLDWYLTIEKLKHDIELLQYYRDYRIIELLGTNNNVRRLSIEEEAILKSDRELNQNEYQLKKLELELDYLNNYGELPDE